MYGSFIKEVITLTTKIKLNLLQGMFQLIIN